MSREEVDIKFTQQQDLWSPVLGMQRAFLQLEQSIASSLEAQAMDTIPPLLFRSAFMIRHSAGREGVRTYSNQSLQAPHPLYSMYL